MKKEKGDKEGGGREGKGIKKRNQLCYAHIPTPKMTAKCKNCKHVSIQKFKKCICLSHV